MADMSEMEENSPVAMTTINPSNTSEWQLYRVLQRANLLQYYDVFIAQGGDDVQQLCEAGEEEFLEIMALVGMASKPLHVRRLQKSLQEWVTNPAAFQGPMIPMGSSSPAPGSISAAVREQALPYPVHSTSVVTAPTWTPQMPPTSVSPANSCSSSGASPKSDLKDEGGAINMMPIYHPQEGMPIGMNKVQSTSPVPTPVLVESQIQGIAESAERLAKELPPFEAKGLNLKKTINREIQTVMNMTEDDPSRMDELRKYAAIYGRFDSKRKNDKPMSLHEISVNEASAQLCKHIPALLTRREDLFPLARQVVRDSGYQYSKGHSRGSNELPSNKKLKLDPVFLRLYENSQKTIKAEMDKLQREQSMTAIHSELAQISTGQEDIKSRVQIAKEAQDYTLVHSLQAELENLSSRQVQLLTEQNDLIVKQRKYDRYIQIISKSSGMNYYGSEDDFGDSSNLPSGASSPQNSLHDGDDLDSSKTDIQQVYSVPPKRSAQKTKQLVKETLFDEGLRIAQQYGMADFAEELKELQQHQVGENDDDSNHGDNGSEAGKNENGARDNSAEEDDDDMEEDADNDRDVSGVWPNGDDASENGDAGDSWANGEASESNDSSVMSDHAMKMSNHSSSSFLPVDASDRANGFGSSVNDSFSGDRDAGELDISAEAENKKDNISLSDTNGYNHKLLKSESSNSVQDDASSYDAGEAVPANSTCAKPLSFASSEGLPSYAKATMYIE